MDRKRWSLPEKLAGLSVVGAVCLFILTSAVDGIIGDQANQLMSSLWDALRKLNTWPWIVTLVILVSGFGVILSFAGRTNRALRKELERVKLEWQTVKGSLDNFNSLLWLDDTLLRLLANWLRAGNREKEMKELLEKLLRDATRVFEREVHRAIIFCPDSTGRYLRHRASHQIPSKTKLRTRFPISKNGDRGKWGFAGTVFMEKEIRVGHILHEIDEWRCDVDYYINFDKDRPFPPYHSFIGIPLIASELDSPIRDADTACFGVVCFDSHNPAFFDNPAVVKLLQIVARRIAVALLIYNQFQKSIVFKRS